MDQATKKRLEDQLRELIRSASPSKEDESPAYEKRSPVVRVIRRRKGTPDLQIA